MKDQVKDQLEDQGVELRSGIVGGYQQHGKRHVLRFHSLDAETRLATTGRFFIHGAAVSQLQRVV